MKQIPAAKPQIAVMDFAFPRTITTKMRILAMLQRGALTEGDYPSNLVVDDSWEACSWVKGRFLRSLLSFRLLGSSVEVWKQGFRVCFQKGKEQRKLLRVIKVLNSARMTQIRGIQSKTPKQTVLSFSRVGLAQCNLLCPFLTVSFLGIFLVSARSRGISLEREGVSPGMISLKNCK